MKRPRQDDELDEYNHLNKKPKVVATSKKRKNEDCTILQPCKKMKLIDAYKEEIQHRRDILLYL